MIWGYFLMRKALRCNSGVAWVIIGARGGLQFCCPQKVVRREPP